MLLLEQRPRDRVQPFAVLFLARDPVEVGQRENQPAKLLRFAVLARGVREVCHDRLQPAHGRVAVFFVAQHLVCQQQRREVVSVVVRAWRAAVLTGQFGNRQRAAAAPAPFTVTGRVGFDFKGLDEQPSVVHQLGARDAQPSRPVVRSRKSRLRRTASSSGSSSP